MLLLAGCLTALIAVASAPRAYGAEAGVGINGESPSQIAAVRTLGVHWVRMFVSWRSLQPTRAPVPATTLAYYEQLFSKLPAGTKVILDVVDSPQWETGSTNERAPPANPHDYASFVASLAARWGSRVTAYEIWNEEDESRWWVGGPDPAGYVRLLKAAYPAIKAADPSATVVLGGLTGNDYPFLEAVYAAGGKGYFDAVGVHTDTSCSVLSPYVFLRPPGGRMVPDSFLAYREVHAVMLANGDAKPIWMTEASWRTTEATCEEGAWAGKKLEGVSEQTQATYLRQAYHCLAQDSYVQVALWFALQDEGPAVSGLLRGDGSQKPSFAAMRSYQENGDQLTEPCGEFSGPKITVLSPGNKHAYSGRLLIHVFATSSLGVYRIRLRIDGKLIRNYCGPTYPTTLSGSIDWEGAQYLTYGRHTLTFVALDKELNESQTSVTINHLGPGAQAGKTNGHKPKAKGHKPKVHKAKVHKPKVKKTRHKAIRHNSRS